MEKEIQKDYRKEAYENVEEVAHEHSKVARDLDIADRIFKTTPREAFITLKDHKEDFEVNPKVRLLNPGKPEIGRPAMKILDNIVKNVREKNTHLNQAISTKDVLIWFNSLENKDQYKFINFDIESFYPSITEDLILKSLNWASEYSPISDQDRKVIIGC